MTNFQNYHLHYARMGNTPPDYKSLLNNLEKYICHEPWLPKNKEIDILDVGCGWGSFLLRLWATGYRHLEGIDISQDQYNIAKKGLPPQIKLNCGDAIAFLKDLYQLYDLIIVFDVLEHLTLEQASSLLLNCHHALRKNGVIVIRVPNMSNILSNYSRYLDITHITGYTEWNLLQLLDMTGFHRHELIKPSFGSFESWKKNSCWKSPLSGFGLREALNSLMHRFLYVLRGQKPGPSVYSMNLTVISFRDECL